MSYRILVIDDEVALSDVFKMILSSEGYEVATASSYDEALRKLDENEFDLVFVDIVLGSRNGIELLREIKQRDISAPVIMITGVPSIETASEAVRLGAFDYIAKPVTLDALLRIASNAIRHRELNDKYETSRTNLEAIFRSVKDSIITVDRDLNLLEYNRAAIDNFGIPEDAAGRPMEDMLRICNNRLLDTIISTINEKKDIELPPFKCIHKKGGPSIYAISTMPLISSSGGCIGAIMVIRDETRIATLEKDLKQRHHFHKLIGRSRKMQKVYEMIEELADLDSTVLISGDSGTGKELVADALHHMGKRSAHNIVKVNCSAISEQLLESDLFGHVKGSFTGAISDKKGRIETADGGTLFLDEIGDLSQVVQVKILRVLQEKEFEPVGSNRTIKVDVRIVAATNRNLRELVGSGMYRKDLYYRLNVFELHMPNLVSRKEDISLLSENFLEKFSSKMDREAKQLSRGVMKLLLEHDWPGNVRELEHVIEYSVAMSKGDSIEVEDLPQEFALLSSNSEPSFSDDERTRIIQALKRSGGKKAPASKMLGISRPTLYEKLKKHNITEHDTN